MGLGRNLLLWSIRLRWEFSGDYFFCFDSHSSGFALTTFCPQRCRIQPWHAVASSKGAPGTPNQSVVASVSLRPCMRPCCRCWHAAVLRQPWRRRGPFEGRRRAARRQRFVARLRETPYVPTAPRGSRAVASSAPPRHSCQVSPSERICRPIMAQKATSEGRSRHWSLLSASPVASRKRVARYR